ncbi:MAG: sulfotransferase, partial [Gammaproteobacteria bacterium]
LTLYVTPQMILWALAPLMIMDASSLKQRGVCCAVWVALRRCVVGLVMLPLLWCLQAWHWIGFLLDEMLYRGYRRVALEAPIFISGVPRSGTTHLYRVMVEHEHLTGMMLWECLLAPSVSQRRLMQGLWRLLAPLARVLVRGKGGRVAHSLFPKALMSIHQLGWQEAEEDFVALIAVNACFLLVLLFPHSAWCWRLADFDRAVSPWKRRVILDFYYALVQKHIYAHGLRARESGAEGSIISPQPLRYISKNPSFTPWVNGLRARFPGARFVMCEREPQKALASQISAVAPAWMLLQGKPIERAFVDRLIAMLARFYAVIDVCCQHSDVYRLPMTRLVTDLTDSVETVMRHVGERITPAFSEYLGVANARAQSYRSGHRYCLSQFSIQWETVQQQFPKRYWQVVKAKKEEY